MVSLEGSSEATGSLSFARGLSVFNTFNVQNSDSVSECSKEYSVTTYNVCDGGRCISD